MPIRYDQYYLADIFQKNSENKIVLPNFQRGFVWKVADQRSILATFLTDLPIGSLLILEGNSGDFAARSLCLPDAITPKEDCEYILDGQQRLSTLRSVFFDLFSLEKKDWKETWDNLYNQLRQRWFLKVRPEQYDDDIFGFNILNFPGFDTLDSDITEFIEIKRIQVKDKDKWFHPAFTPDAVQNISQYNLSIAKEAAKDYLVPLYQVYLKDKGIHRLVLKQIARNQAELLKAKVQDGALSLEDILVSVEPDIHNLVESQQLDEIDNAWRELEFTWHKSVSETLESILDKKIPVILLPKNEINRAVSIFESINRGGTSLSVYDLVVARAAKEKNAPPLSERLKNYIKNTIEIPEFFPIEFKSWTASHLDCLDDDDSISKDFREAYQNVLSILTYGKINSRTKSLRTEHIKREKILSLSAEQINSMTEKTVTSILRALLFLQLYCGVISIKSISYRLIVLPLAYILDEDSIWFNESNLKKVIYWYWITIFSGVFRENQNEKSIEETRFIYSWLVENKDCELLKERMARVLNYQGYNDIDTLLSKNKENNIHAAVKYSIYQYILSQHPIDFLCSEKKIMPFSISNNSFQKNLLEVHHIIPLASAKTISGSASQLRENKKHILNSPLNCTYISKEANRKIRDLPLTAYLSELSGKSIIGHSLPSPEKIKRKEDEDEYTYYERILAERYEIILRDLKKQLMLLV